MALSGVDVPKMQWIGDNLRENWSRFKQHAELMFSGPLKSRPEAEKCSYLLIWSGQKGRDIFNTWQNLTQDDKKKLQTYYDRFEQHVGPKSNPVFAQYKFRQKIQSPDESIEQFTTELQILAQDCEFTNTDEMIHNRIVFSTKSMKTREKLFDEGRSYSRKGYQNRTILRSITSSAKIYESRWKRGKNRCYFAS